MSIVVSSAVLTSAVVHAQVPSLQGSAARAHELKASDAQIEAVASVLKPMEDAINSLKNYQLDFNFSLNISVGGTPFIFDATLKEWYGALDQFYVTHTVNQGSKPIVALATFGNSKESKIYNSLDQLYVAVLGEYSANTRTQLIHAANPYIGILYTPKFRAATLKGLTPEQSPVNVTDETLEGEVCKKVSVGTAPQQTVYWYKNSPPHLPIAFSHYTTAGSTTVKISGKLKWTLGVDHCPTIFSSSLPSGTRKTEDYFLLIDVIEKAKIHAIRSGLPTVNNEGGKGERPLSLHGK